MEKYYQLYSTHLKKNEILIIKLTKFNNVKHTYIKYDMIKNICGSLK